MLAPLLLTSSPRPDTFAAMKSKPRIVAFASGRGSNFCAIADDLRASANAQAPPAEVVLLISDNPDAPAIAEAERRGIATALVDPGQRPGRLPRESTDRILHLLDQHGADLVVLAGFMRILPKRMVRAHAGQILNVHPSLLPSFRGLDAQAQAVNAGVRIAGCTVHFVDEGMDTGPILLQAAVAVHRDDTSETLAARILVEEHRIYAQAVRLFVTGRIRLEDGRVFVLDEPPTMIS